MKKRYLFPNPEEMLNFCYFLFFTRFVWKFVVPGSGAKIGIVTCYLESGMYA
jgi:hypothetical protein